MKSFATAAVTSMLSLTLACSSTPAASDPPDAAPVVTTIDAGVADATVNTFQPLISRSWSLQAGQTDIYRCTRVQLAQDTTITGFRSVAPFGTHHGVLTIASPDAPLGDFDCDAGVLDSQMLYASGLGTDDLIFPSGTGIKLPAGTKISLNLHLFNATDNAISGTSGVMIQTADQVSTYIDMTFGGTMNITIPNTGLTVNVTGVCTLARDYTVFDLWPHMHQIATHQKVVWNHAGTDQTLLDDDYQFTSQKNYPLASPVAMHAGDTITTTCSYVNNEDHTVIFGDKSTDEMCFTGIYRYPAGGTLFECIQQ